MNTSIKTPTPRFDTEAQVPGVSEMSIGRALIADALHGALKIWFEARHLSAHLSLTDESDYATSFCVLECVVG